MSFVVYDSGKPACYPYYRADPPWNNNRFETFQEAVDYAKDWLGKTFFPIDSKIRPNEPVNYYGHFYILIKEEP